MYSVSIWYTRTCNLFITCTVYWYMYMYMYMYTVIHHIRVQCTSTCMYTYNNIERSNGRKRVMYLWNCDGSHGMRKSERGDSGRYLVLTVLDLLAAVLPRHFRCGVAGDLALNELVAVDDDVLRVGRMRELDVLYSTAQKTTRSYSCD